jgi:hypothetical protein
LSWGCASAANAVGELCQGAKMPSEVGLPAPTVVSNGIHNRRLAKPRKNNAKKVFSKSSQQNYVDILFSVVIPNLHCPVIDQTL